jgi:hypothetical protein
VKKATTYRDLSRRRNRNEAVNVAIKQTFGTFVWSRLWWNQFQELVIKCVVHNLEGGLAIAPEEGERQYSGWNGLLNIDSKFSTTGPVYYSIP